MTLAEAEAQLLTVNAAIEQLIQGKRLTKLVVDSGQGKREYTYQEISMQMLQTLKVELQAVVNALTPGTPAAPVFATNMSFEHIVRKGVR
jgi:hypothetical protein